MRCPKCQKEGSIGLVHDALVMPHDTSGPHHILGCTKCGWTRPTVNKGLHRLVQLNEVIKEEPK